MRKPEGLSKREFLRWTALGAGAAALGTLATAPLRPVNAVLLAAPARAKGCREDICTTTDAPDSTCVKRDVCDVDTSLHCRVDECVADSSGDCERDLCVSDKSGGCSGDECDADSSGACTTDVCSGDSSGGCDGDACRTDSSGGCTADACGDDSSKECVTDTCVADSTGECESDVCVADSSGECVRDECISDKSGGCEADDCVSDTSGGCAEDDCRSDSSGDCDVDGCRTDSSGACTEDVCVEDSSKGCDRDDCVADSSGSCTRDSCTEDASGDNDSGLQECDIDLSDACVEDRCVSDHSGPCVRDLCVHDTSDACDVDQCREDSSPEPCRGRDTCAQDVAMGPRVPRRELGRTGLGRALRWLYEVTAVVTVAAALHATALAETAIDATNAIFSPEPEFTTGAQVTVSAPVGPFLRDVDADGVLEADTNGDGLADGDPEVRDWDGDGTRELPPGTAFTGTFEYTCFYVPSDVRIESSGPLTIRASREVAVFGALTLRSGISVASPGPVDAWTSVWMSEDGSGISLTTGLPGDVERTKQGLPADTPLGPVPYTQACDIEGAALRAVSPSRGTVGTVITIRGANLGKKKGRVRVGKAKVRVLSWLPERVTCEIRKVPRKALGTLDVVVRPKGTKRADELVFPAAFEVPAPVIAFIAATAVEVGDEVEVVGDFFGAKRPRVQVGKKKAKVVGWSMENATGSSHVAFVVPKKLDAGVTYPATLRTKTGSPSFELTLDEPLVVDPFADLE